MKISASSFKSKCLELLDYVNESSEEIVITKQGKPVAKLVPCNSSIEKQLFGFMKGSVQVNADIVKPIAENWDSDF
ncbi:MAG: type II toxin-antitoxin system prevent-host-death family antitoxin [Calditrichaeota bacterium]|nr:MAG: type II toxin-antitoxin system prevent-host-death family antitoxin [Calditrichota bacterium]MBL1206095.1 type II toxin-antitoxin system prevent-host-death family antitoxin [Calditrichota bacterium]NOG45921.1 type II toxin-antitoxin system prevent-host-death family antitoxin [Calditrichota bacterium]